MSLSTLPTVELLRRVIGSGEVATIAYNGGTRPGQARAVVPLSLSTGELVAAEPHSSVNKTYKVNLIAWVELSSGQRASNPNVLPPSAPKPPARVPDAPHLPSLAAYIEHYRAELIGAGWHLFEEADSFAVGSRFKSGKPKKTPSIWLRYLAPSPESTAPRASIALMLSSLSPGELVTSVERIEYERTRKPRPWRVDSWRLPMGKTFAELQPAFSLFVDEVRLSDPATAKGAFSGH